MSRIIVYIAFFICTMAVSPILRSQPVDAFSYIEKYNQRLDSIKNYTAEFTVKSTIPLINMPVVQGKMFFKWPAHYSISTYAFTILPLRKLIPVARLLRRENFKILDKGMEKMDSHSCRVLELQPRDTTSEILFYTVWVDMESYLVRRLFITKKDDAEFTYYYRYKNNNDLLPSALIYSFEFMEKKPIPVALNPISLANKIEEPKLIKGKIVLDFNYSDIRHEGD